MKRKLALINILRLIRWKNILIYWFITGILFYHFSSHIHSIENYILLIIFFSFLGIAGNLQNNYWDYELDRKKAKFIDFNRTKIKRLYQVFYLLSLLIAFYISIINKSFSIFIVLIFTILSMNLYNLYLKKIMWIGNFIIALLSLLSVALPICQSIMNCKKIPGILFLFYMIFLTSLIRELIKDIEDKKYDKLFNYNTLPIYNTQLSYTILWMYLILYISILILFFSIFNSILLYGFLIFSLLTFILTIFFIKQDKVETATRLIKLLMLAGIIFFIYGTKNIR